MYGIIESLPCGCTTSDDEGLYCNCPPPPACGDCGADTCEACFHADYEMRAAPPMPIGDLITLRDQEQAALNRSLAEARAADPAFVAQVQMEIATMRAHQERPFDDNLPQWWAAPEDFYGTGEKRPAALTRDDGETLIYRNTLNWIGGLAGSGKSWVALVAALRSDRAFYWDFEDTSQTLGERATLLGGIDIVTDDTRFRYARGHNLLHDYGDGDQADRADFDAAVTWLGDGLLVIDTASSAGCPMDGGDVIPWIQEFIDPWKARGATIIVIDHIPKGKDRAPGPIGSQHKQAAPDGAVYSIEQRTAWNKTNDGRITLVLVKDRHGDVPAQVNRPAATIRGNFNQYGGFGYTIDNPGDTTNVSDAPGDDLDARIVAAVREHGTHPTRILTYTRLKELVGPVSRTRLTETTQRLHDEGLVVRRPYGRGLKFTPPDAEPEAPTLTEAAS